MSKRTMTANQMIEAMQNMTNDDRIEFLHYLSNKHFKIGQPSIDMYEAVKNYIEDNIDQQMTKQESTVMKLAYDEGYNVGVHDGMEKILKNNHN